MDLTQQTIGKLRQMLDSKEISAPELTQSYLDRIAKYDDTIQSYITVTAERALADAAAAQKKIDAGNAGVLCGIPMAIKDNICTDGIKTTCASKMLEDFIPPYNATVMEKLAAQDIVMLGKASMDEFAMGGSTQTSAFAKTRNPFNTECVPGGSSGGSSGGGSSAPAAPSAYPLPKGQETSKSLGVFNYDMTYAVTLTAQDGADIYYEIAEGKDKAPVPTTKSKKFETYQYGQIEITQPTASADGPVTKTYNVKAIAVKNGRTSSVAN